MRFFSQTLSAKSVAIPFLFGVCFLLDCFIQQSISASGIGIVLSFLSVVFLSLFYQGPLTLATIFILGFCYDVFLGTIMGFTPLIWLGIHFLVVSNHAHFLNKSIFDAWLGFVFLAFLWSFAQWFIHVGNFEGFLGLYKPIMNTVILAAFFPIPYIMIVKSKYG